MPARPKPSGRYFQIDLHKNGFSGGDAPLSASSDGHPSCQGGRRGGRHSRGVRRKVEVHAWVSQHHPEFWENHDAFDPEHFAPEKPPPAKGAYFPFLIGRRACLGEHFAMLEGIVAITSIASCYRLEWVEEEAMGTRPISTLRYSRALKMKVLRRF